METIDFPSSAALMQIKTKMDKEMEELRPQVDIWLTTVAKDFIIAQREEGMCRAFLDIPTFAKTKKNSFIHVLVELLSPLGYDVSEDRNKAVIDWEQAIKPKVNYRALMNKKEKPFDFNGQI
jgi:hypothetical protein